MNTCNCSECIAKRRQIKSARNNTITGNYNPYRNNLFNRIFNEVYEEEFNLQRLRKLPALTDDKSTLRKQARNISRHKFSGVTPGGQVEVDHIIPLQFSHLFKTASGFRMDDFEHPNSPKNLRIVTPALHKLINNKWRVFTDGIYKRALANKETALQLKNRVSSYAQNVVNPLAASMGAKNISTSGWNLTNNELELLQEYMR